MPLDAPSKLDWFWRLAPAVKAIIVVVVLTVVIGAVLFASDRITGWWAARSIDKHKANVNAALSAVNDAKADLGNQRVSEAVALEQVTTATEQAIEASEASDEAKQAARIALERYEAARLANALAGTTELELLRALDGLE